MLAQVAPAAVGKGERENFKSEKNGGAGGSVKKYR